MTNIPCCNCIVLSMCKNKEVKSIVECPLVKDFISKKPEDETTAVQHIGKWNSICDILGLPKYKFAYEHFE